MSALDRVTIAQRYEAYQTYQKLAPSAHKLLKVWNWAQWLLNPVAAIAKRATKESSTSADRHDCNSSRSRSSPARDWQAGTRPKEIAMREAVAYRNEFLATYCDLVLPLVNANPSIDRLAWGVDTLSLALLQSIEPSKQIRLARFLRNLDARIVAAASMMDLYLALN